MGRYVDKSIPDFCRDVSRPGIPSPAGGSVIAVVGALAASLSGLAAQVSQNSGPSNSGASTAGSTSGTSNAGSTSGAFGRPSLASGASNSKEAKSPSLPELVSQMEDIRTKLLNDAEEDIYDTARMLQKSGDRSQRSYMAAPAKMARHLLDLLRILLQFKPYCDRKVASDLRVAAHLARAGVLAISEIEYDNASSEQAPLHVLTEIRAWRDDALAIAGTLLQGHQM